MATSISARDEIHIAASAEQVFEVVSNYRDTSSWLPVYRCEYLNGDTLHEGLCVSHQYGRPPFVMSSFTRRIDAIDPGRGLRESYIDGDLRGHGAWHFEPRGQGCMASYSCEVTAHTWFPRLTFRLFGHHAHSNVYKPLLKKLKAHCEALDEDRAAD